MRGQMDKSLILKNWDPESLRNQCPGVKRQASFKEWGWADKKAQ